MVASKSRSSFRKLASKVGAPSFRPGMGEIYRQLEAEGVIANSRNAEARVKDADQAARLRRAREQAGQRVTRGAVFSRPLGWLRD